MHYLGKGVPQDDTQAMYWYRLAAEQGYPREQFSLGLLYTDLGSGVPESDGEKQCIGIARLPSRGMRKRNLT